MMKREEGAVWVEFLVVSSTVLLSMFYLIPMLAKYMDVSHTTEQAARYGAWERTVWYGDVGPYQGKTENKSSSMLQNEITQRVLGDGVIYSQQNTTPELSKFKLGSFYHYNNLHKGTYDELIIKKNGGSYILFSEPSSDDVGPAKGVKAIDKLLHTVDKVLEKETPVNTKSYFTNKASIDANIPFWMDAFKGSDFKDKKLAFNASNSILVDAWGAGGIKDNQDKVKAMRPIGVNKALDLELSALEIGFYPYYWFSKEIRNKRLNLDKVDVEQLLEGEDPNNPNSHVEKF